MDTTITQVYTSAHAEDFIYYIDTTGRLCAERCTGAGAGSGDKLVGAAAFDRGYAALASETLGTDDKRALRAILGLGRAPFEYVLTDERAQPPRRAHASDAGYDLVIIDVAKRVQPEPGPILDIATRTWQWLTDCLRAWLPGEVVLYETGVAVQPPHGYYFELVPRSSIVKSGYMLANNVGVIDASYQGTIKVPLVRWCWWAREPEMPARLVQLVLRRQYNADGVQVESFGCVTARGAGGFGSTGDGAVATTTA